MRGDGLFELHPSRTAKRVIENAKREWAITKFRQEKSFDDLSACTKMVHKFSENYSQAIKDRDKYNGRFLNTLRKTLDDADGSMSHVSEKASECEY